MTYVVSNAPNIVSAISSGSSDTALRNWSPRYHHSSFRSNCSYIIEFAEDDIPFRSVEVLTHLPELEPGFQLRESSRRQIVFFGWTRDKTQGDDHGDSRDIKFMIAAKDLQDSRLLVALTKRDNVLLVCLPRVFRDSLGTWSHCWCQSQRGNTPSRQDAQFSIVSDQGFNVLV